MYCLNAAKLFFLFLFMQTLRESESCEAAYALLDLKSRLDVGISLKSCWNKKQDLTESYEEKTDVIFNPVHQNY